MRGDDKTDVRSDLAVIKSQLEEINRKLDRYIPKIEQHDKDITQLTVEIKNFNSFQTILTFIGTAVASAVGWIINQK